MVVPYIILLLNIATFAAYCKNIVTGLVRLESPVSLGVFSRASFAIQPRPRLRTLLDGAGPQAHGVALLCSSAS